ncbi:tyrosine-type recombinase/integrase [Cohnella abietis]|uniref:tyrosine-type recombinase/integrase n=1 Tax=Cohnella abietis TaxID=2507935 RepID=UPI001300B99B|nr:site-specific integrase [Cohnella abietis]
MSLKVKKSLFTQDDGTTISRYSITEDEVPIAEINRWIQFVSTNSPLTGQRYAYVIVSFLEYLKIIKMHYRDVTDKATLEGYVHYLLGYSGEVVAISGGKTIDTVRNHISVLKNFYDWLEDGGAIEQSLIWYGHKKDRKGNHYVNKKFLYGQIYNFNNSRDNALFKKFRFKKKQEHIKWYTIDEIQSLVDHLPSHKDRIIFRISVECGLRIGEILGLHLTDINRFENEIKVVYQLNSDNEAYAKTSNRDVPILDDIPIIAQPLMTDIENYIAGERESADIYVSPFLFLNNKGKYRGRPVTRRNFLSILKRTAKKLGMNPSKIRTHSGRSTRAEILVEKSFEKGIDINIIADYLGHKPDTLRKFYQKKTATKTRRETLRKLAPSQIKEKEDDQ